MKIFWKYFPLIPVALVACISVYLVEGLYCQLINGMYKFFGSGKIDYIGTNYIPSAEYFIASFGAFCTFIAYRIISKPESSTVINFIMAIVLFFLTTAVICYADTAAKTVSCTVCDVNRRFVFSSRDIGYNQIFIMSLIVSLAGFMLYERLSSTLLLNKRG